MTKRKRFIYTEEIIVDAESEDELPTCQEIKDTMHLTGMGPGNWWVAGRPLTPVKVEEFVAKEAPHEIIARLERELAEVKASKVVYRLRGADMRGDDGKCIECGGWGAGAGCPNCGMTCMGG